MQAWRAAIIWGYGGRHHSYAAHQLCNSVFRPRVRIYVQTALAHNEHLAATPVFKWLRQVPSVGRVAANHGQTKTVKSSLMFGSSSVWGGGALHGEACEGPHPLMSLLIRGFAIFRRWRYKECVQRQGFPPFRNPLFPIPCFF